jgi:hypothetical protein
MQLVFLSTMEKKVEEDRILTAQVSITEHQGVWRVLWSEAGPDGKAGQDMWYEGSNWKEMLKAYREGLRLKRIGGYFPLVDASLPGHAEQGKGRDLLMLQFYAEKHHSGELFEELRKWRRQQAQKEGKSAFFVATNRMLFMVSAYLPQSVEELRQIQGFGQRKVEAYSKELLELTMNQARTWSFPLDWVLAEVDEAEFESWIAHQQRSREQQEQQKEYQKRKVLEGVASGLSLLELEASSGMRRQDLVKLVEELDQGGYDMEPLLVGELSGVGQEKLDCAWELFAKHGTRFLKPVLKELYTEEELKDMDMNGLYEKLRLQRIRFRRSSITPAAASEETVQSEAGTGLEELGGQSRLEAQAAG